MQPAPLLLTPGPLTTSLDTRTAMLTDWGSWDSAFNDLTASVCQDLLRTVNGVATHACIPLQGSGTFAVEAALGTFVPRSGKLLVLENGAYGQRMATIARTIGLNTEVLSWPDGSPVDVATVRNALQADANLTHIALIHCETATGLLNPLAEIAALAHQFGRELIVDAMSSFGALPIDLAALNLGALVAASGKCLEGVPGMGFVIAKTALIAAAQGNSPSVALDLADQYRYMQRTGQWRFTPPTHVVAALRSALDQFLAEGGQAARYARYSANALVLIQRLKTAGLALFLDESVQAPIILTFHAPAHPDYVFTVFYEAMRNRGFVLYPGKLTQIDTFRVGCIGAISPAQLEQAAHAIVDVLTELGWLPQKRLAATLDND